MRAHAREGRGREAAEPPTHSIADGTALRNIVGEEVAATLRASEIRLGGSLFVCMSVGASCKPTLLFFSLRENFWGKKKSLFNFSFSSLFLFRRMSSGFLFSPLLGLVGSDIGRLVHRRRCIPQTLHCAECYHVSPPVFVSRSTRLQTPAVCPIREEVPRMALRVSYPKSSHSED